MGTKKAYPATRWNLFRHRRELSFGEGCDISSTSIFRTGRSDRIRMGRKCKVDHGAFLAAYGGWIELGDNVSVNCYAVLHGNGGLKIGDGVRIAAHAVLVSANHRFGRMDVPIYQQGMDRKGVTIGDDVWIGANVVVLDGSIIGKGCVIAAGAVVRGTLEPYGVYGGVPVRKLRQRQDVVTGDQRN